MAVSQRLKELLVGDDGVLGGASGQTAHIHLADLGLSLSGETINKMKDHGVYGREASLRTLAAGYATEFWRRHGEAIATFAGIEDPSGLSPDKARRAAADWFVYEVVTSRPDIPRPNQAGTSEPLRGTRESADPTAAADSPTPDVSELVRQTTREVVEELRAQGWRSPEELEPTNLNRLGLAGQGKPKAYALFPRARDYFWARFGQLAELCETLGLPEPAIPSFRGGSDSLTHAEADAKLDQILEELRAEHPEQARALVLE